MEKQMQDIAEAIGAQVEAMRGEIVRCLVDLVRCPTVNPPSDTSQAMAVVARYIGDDHGGFAHYGLDDKKRSAVITLRGQSDGPSLLYNSHLDTVPIGDRNNWRHDPLGAEVEGGVLYGRGCADAKGCCAAMLMSLKVLRRLGLPRRGTLTLQLVADEETGGHGGTGYLLHSQPYRPDYVVIGEITDNQVAIAEKGLTVVDVITHGRTAHASTPWYGINAISKMARFLVAYEEFAQEHWAGRRHPLVPPPSYNFGLIEGGVASNVVADTCRVRIDRRILPTETFEQAEAEMRTVLDRLAAADRDFRAEMAVRNRINPFEMPLDADLVQWAQEVLSALGRPTEPIGYEQVSDGRWFMDAGIPTIIVGPGIAHEAHTPDEKIALDEVVAATRLYALLAARILG